MGSATLSMEQAEWAKQQGKKKKTHSKNKQTNQTQTNKQKRSVTIRAHPFQHILEQNQRFSAFSIPFVIIKQLWNLLATYYVTLTFLKLDPVLLLKIEGVEETEKGTTTVVQMLSCLYHSLS